MWSACPRLTFDAVALCKCDRDDLREHTGKFINEVNAILHKYRGKVVETLEVRMDFVDNLLAHHIDTWVDFAVSSHTKRLTLDLKPDKFFMYNDRYLFPFQLFDGRSISHLQHMQLSFVSLIPPSQFRGFPNLRKLHLQIPHVNREDLEQVLSHYCHNLEWLRLDRCFLDDELTVLAPLSRLLYLRVEWCKFTRIEFHAVNLTTFEYDGRFIPIDLTHSSKLQTANIDFLDRVVLQHALTSFLKGPPSVQNLSLKIGSKQLERQWFPDKPQKFSNLKHLRLHMFLFSEEAEDLVLYSVSFLRAAPFMEKLEVHFCSTLWLAEVGPCRKEVGQCKYSYLKDIWITGFKGARGQLELLLHVVENAPVLESVSVKIGDHHIKETWPYEGRPPVEEAKQVATTWLNTVLPETVKFDVID